MKTELTWGGIGPKLALICLPYVALSLWVVYREPEFLSFKAVDSTITNSLGFLLSGFGFLFWIVSAIIFIIDFRKGKLITRGTYSLCRNPIYASIIVFIIPGLAFILQSGMILTIAVVIYINFRISIHGEYKLLEQHFGEEYEAYKKSVNEMFPFPRYLFKR